MLQQTNLHRPYLIILFFSINCFISQINYAQNIVNINNLTGTANAAIPIYTVSVGDLSASVALTYNASGLKVEDYDNTYGQGWRFVAQSSVTRTVRGFPDDAEYQTDGSYSVIKGWLRSGNTAPQTIQSTGFANTGSLNCGSEISDATTIAGNYSYAYDTEPDYFSVSAPGLSCNFVFDGTSNHIIKMIPYRDYNITYTTDVLGRIASFTVLNENGIKYIFNVTTLVKQSVDIYNPGTATVIDPSTLEVFKRDFMMYRTPGYPTATPVIKYSNQWVLSKMIDTRGNEIRFNYGNAYYTNNPTIQQKISYKKIEILKPDGSGGFTKKLLYGITTISPEYHIQSISTFSLGQETGSLHTVVNFGWGTPGGSYEDERLQSISLPLERKSYELIYTKKFLGSTTVWYGFGRYFLKSLKLTTTSGLCNNVYSQFDFSYYQVNEANNTCYCTPVVPNTNPPVIIDTIINAQDYWGYHNGKFQNPNLNPQIYAYPDNPTFELFKTYPIPGYSPVTLTETADRSVNDHSIDGSLKKITYPTGATTEMEYESNEFFDNDVNGNVMGGGIRIKKITNNDGFNTLDVTNYSYNDPVYTSVTTGRAVSVPKFAIAFRNNATYGNSTDRIKNCTYRTTYDLNNESKEILYGKVTVTKTGVGKSIYEYNTSGTFGSSPTTDWAESLNSVSRTDLSSPTPCNAIMPGFLINSNLTYPFTPNPNFDFERGLPTKSTHYNETGQVVAYEEYSYSRSHTSPEKIYGAKLDEMGNTAVSYGRYPVNATVDNFLVTKTSRLYNSNTSSPVEEVETYEYTSPGSTAAYRLLKAARKQNSGDPATAVTRFKYSKEYAATSTTGDYMNEALYYFNNNNKNVLVETTQSREQSGQSEKFLGGNFSTYKKVTVGDVPSGGTTVNAYIPYRSYQFANPAGVTNFVPSTISSNAFIWDVNNYINTPSTIEQYNLRGIPQVITDNSRIPKTTLSTTVVNGVKVADFVNAQPVNIGFSNFEPAGYGDMTFSNGGNSLVAGGRYSDYCLSFQPGTTVCRTITKSTTAKNLIVSFWLKDAASNGTMYLCFQKFGGSCGTFSCTGASTAISFTGSSVWKYYQFVVPWGSSTYTTLSYGLSTSVAVKIDDILIYPDNANVSTYSYTTNSIGTNLLTAKTGINGIGNSYEYDNAGRLWLVRDQFDNIIEMKKYKLVNRHAIQIPSIQIGYPYQPIVLGNSASFTAMLPYSYETGDCEAPQIVYTWNFGDGTSTATSSGSGTDGHTSIQHSYASIGDYQVSVTASSPGMTNVVAYTPPTNSTDPPHVKVTNPSDPPPVCNPGTPVICAAGIIQYTSSNQCILATCNPLPSTCTDTYFQVASITGGTIGSVYSVQWETAPEGSSSWSVYQPETQGTPSTSVHFHIIHTTSYQMRAKVKFCDSTTNYVYYSNVILIKNGD